MSVAAQDRDRPSARAVGRIYPQSRDCAECERDRRAASWSAGRGVRRTRSMAGSGLVVPDDSRPTAHQRRTTMRRPRPRTALRAESRPRRAGRTRRGSNAHPPAARRTGKWVSASFLAAAALVIRSIRGLVHDAVAEASLKRGLVQDHGVLHIVARVRDHGDDRVRTLRILVEAVLNVATGPHERCLRREQPVQVVVGAVRQRVRGRRHRLLAHLTLVHVSGDWL